MELDSSSVFGINTKVSDYSYVDRGSLDKKLKVLSKRDQHISLCGESKSGKSWLRQKNFPNAIVVQCRIGFKPIDIYTSIFSDLGIKLKVNQEVGASGSLSFSASGKIGWELLGKAEAELDGAGSYDRRHQEQSIGRDLGDLRFICEVIKASGKRVIIEDFHYLETDSQKSMAHDLKAMWDYSTYIIIIGVWVKRNYLTYLNPDLAGRISEVNVYWNNEDLAAVVAKGCGALNVSLGASVKGKLIEDSFGNVGLLQSLILETLDEAGIEKKEIYIQSCDDIAFFESAALSYAEQLEAVYLEFARRVASGIRKRKGSTKIYAHTMWAVFESSSEELIQGVPTDTIFERAYSRQPRTQKGNLKSILPRLDGLQVDDRGKGLVVTYVEQSDRVAVVDRTVLFYRKYCTVDWPWEAIIRDVDEDGLEADAN